ncbi:hypothetical protein PACTADRAFT_38449 [Pachysolen tannophilus NRRL Y-2460]|uniref:DUF4536 domain-containing protein n=1 Tax=Pachysolen tannophilus NRRL Y-2460 TaxID=669874 RepID=A0A1E4U0K1_PACTA|nr:hypothetical protein PACTADRAFT_38449 [Pachysolen tannophilus NRRL Y-2460]
MSNIIDIFVPPKPRDLSEDETADCVPCQMMAFLFGVGGGLYFSSGRVFKGEKIGDNPMWWKYTVRTGGLAMIAYGAYRGGQGWLWDKDRVYKRLQ